MIEIWGTVEQLVSRKSVWTASINEHHDMYLTAETICAPFLMMADCSALEPTMNPVTLWRNMMGVSLLSSQQSKVKRTAAVVGLLLIAQSNKLGAFRCFIAIDDRCLVRDDADFVSWSQ